MKRARITGVCAGMALLLLATGCATPTLLSKPKVSSKAGSSAQRSSQKSGRSAKPAGGGSPSNDEIPDAHAVGLGVKGG